MEPGGLHRHHYHYEVDVPLSLGAHGDAVG